MNLWGKRIVRKCLACKKRFKILKSQIKGKHDHRCCSIKCASIQRKTKIGKLSPSWKGGLIKINCIVCAKLFSDKPSHIKFRKCCSRKCLGIYRKIKAQEGKIRKLKNSQHTCPQCGVKILRRRVLYPGCRQKFCSFQCYILWQKGRQAGDKNPNWKGGVTSLRKMLYYSEEAAAWREAVRTRDNYTCQRCGKQENLHAHHIVRLAILLNSFCANYDQFSPIEDKETLFRLATKWKPFWDVNNGLTVCTNCHRNEEDHATLGEIARSGAY